MIRRARSPCRTPGGRWSGRTVAGVGAVPVERGIDDSLLILASFPLQECLEGMCERRRLHSPHANREAPSARKPRDDGLTIPVEELPDPDAACWMHSCRRRTVLLRTIALRAVSPIGASADAAGIPRKGSRRDRLQG